MPIPKPEKKRHAPRSAGHRKRDFASAIMRARVRRAELAKTRAKRLAYLRASHGVPSLSNERRRAERLSTFGARPLATASNAV